MVRKIDPLFADFGITYQEKLPENVEDIPINHPAYKDIWRRIGNYTDKYFLAQKFKEDEEESDELEKKYKIYESMLELDDEIQIFSKVHPDLRKYLKSIGKKGLKQKEYRQNYFLHEIFKISEKLTPEQVAIFNKNPKYSRKDCERDLSTIKEKIENKFSLEIPKKYPFECNLDNRIELELETRADLIIQDKNTIKDNFKEMLRTTKAQIFEFEINSAKNTKEIALKVCQLLEKHFGLRYNPKNGIYYISNGEGMYVPFDETNLDITNAALRDKFIAKYKTKDGKAITKNLIMSKSDFYSIAPAYSIIQSESEQDIISFPNCCYDSKLKIIHEFDYRLPRLPMKSCNVNFIFDRDLTGQGGALEEILNYCFDEKSRDIIFQYYGRALFEKGFTESQEALLVLGKGDVGKTTFFKTLSKIFNKVPTLSASSFHPGNDFAFGELPGCDFFLMDEITTSKEGFVDTIKEYASGADSLYCNKKYKNPVNLDAEYIPRCIMIGNALPEHIYKESAGIGVLRRFPIIFLKHSILKAKKLTATVTIDGKKKEYPAVYGDNSLYLIPNPTEITDNGDARGQLHQFEDNKLIPLTTVTGNAIIGTQSRTNFTLKELNNSRSLEWFLQQVILKYKPSAGKFFSEAESHERFLKAYKPEKWVIQKCVEANFDYYGKLDETYEINVEDLLKDVHEQVEKHMLEKTIFNPFSDDIIKIIKETINLKPEVKNSKGKRLFVGLSFDAEKINY